MRLKARHILFIVYVYLVGKGAQEDGTRNVSIASPFHTRFIPH